MDIGTYYHTLRYLKFRQISYQLIYRIRKLIRQRVGFKYALSLRKEGTSLSLYPFISKYDSLDNNTFCFLNQTSEFTHWNDEKYGRLWSYNLNYMDFIHQQDSSLKTGCYWINKFIDEIASNSNGLEPYPIALRGINWIKFISIYHLFISTDEKQKWDSSLYAQYKILQDNLEYHLLGNHLLEDAFSMLWAGLYFRDESFYNQAERLLCDELNEQILPDGAHYELSPMYHEILLDRLLDCVNISRQNLRFGRQEELIIRMEEKAVLMLGWLESIIYQDDSIPLLSDAAYGIAPEAKDIFSYARRLGLSWERTLLKESGYRKFESAWMEMVMDVGRIGPDYIPGHAHADTFTYELRIDGKPFIVDTGISTYDKNQQRQYERETRAHNTVTVEGISSSQVWGGFRVAKRVSVSLLEDNKNFLKAIHDGYKDIGVMHERVFSKLDDRIVINDTLRTNTAKQGLNTIILSPTVSVLSIKDNLIYTNLGKIQVEGTDRIWIEACEIAASYNALQRTQKICCSFTSHMEYSIFRNSAS